MNTIEIPFSKSKLALAIIGSALFVTLGAFLVFSWSDELGASNNMTKKVLGIICMLFFGAVGIFGIIKLFSSKSAMTINEEGILDNTTATSFGLIKWENITGFKIEEMMSKKYLVIQVDNGEEMIEKSKGFLRKTMKMNYSMYRTPIAIPSTVVNYKLPELKELLEKMMDEKNS